MTVILAHIRNIGIGNIGIGNIGVLLGAALIGFFAGSLAAKGFAQDAPQVVTEQTVEYQFLPAELVFRPGVLYRLHLENTGHEMHEFTAPDFFKAVDVKNPDVLVAGGNEVLLQPGDSKDVLFVPRAAGTYRLTCADHDWAGMVGDIVVR